MYRGLAEGDPDWDWFWMNLKKMKNRCRQTASIYWSKSGLIPLLRGQLWTTLRTGLVKDSAFQDLIVPVNKSIY